jgi:hypothetical protein
VDPGAGRVLDQRVEGIQHYSLLDADDVVLRALRRGRSRTVHGFADNGNVRSEPHIALVTPAIADLPAAEIRIDICLRGLWRLLVQGLCFRLQEGRSRSGFPFAHRICRSPR